MPTLANTTIVIDADLEPIRLMSVYFYRSISYEMLCIRFLQECPSLWRLYEYLTDDQRDATLRNRIEKSKFTLGQGGEGYIATDEWCYNCGGSGHWGDVRPSPISIYSGLVV